MKRILLFFGILSCWTSNAQLVAPVTESFDNSSLPTGWAISATSGGPWLFSGSTNSVFCTAAADNTGNSGNYAWMDQSSGDGGVILEMDTVDVSALTVPYLEFYYWMCGQGYTPFNVTIIEAWDGVSTWSRVDSITISTNGWQKLGFDISSFTYGNNRVKIRFRAESGGSTLDFYGDNALDDISVVEAPPCPPPSGFTVSNIQATTADLSWATSITAGNWDVYWGTTGFDPQTSGSTANSTTNSYNITGLTGNTLYDAYLVADCGINGVSDTIGPLPFRTACVAEIVGYNNGFENDPSNAAPLCWTPYISNTSATVTIVTFSTPYLGSQHLRLNSGFAGNTDTTSIVSPQLTGLTSGLNQIRFFTQTDNTAEELIIGTVSSPANPGSFSAIDTIRFASTFNYEEIIVPITAANGYNGTDEYVVFKRSMNATFNGLFIDEFNYEVIPPCPKITGIAVNGLTDSSATFGFNSSGSTVGYEWGPVGFAQGTGTTDSISANPLTINGLTGNTSYDLYLRNDCNPSGNGTSVWTGPFTFTTACSPLTAPYTTSFDLTTAPTLDNCWTPINMTNVTFSEVGTDGFRNFSAPNSMELHNSSGITGFLGAASPNFSDLDSNKRIQFMAYDEDGSFDGSDLIIGTMSNLSDTSTFTPWDTITEADMDDDVWELFIVSFEGYTGTDNYIVFKHGLNTTFDNIHIDDFVYEVLPSCIGSIITSLDADSIRSTSITASWDGGQGTTTNIEWGIAGFTPGTGTNLGSGSVPGSDTTFAITGLSSNTNYDFYIQDTCLVGGAGIWVGPLSFKTKCIITAATLPFFDGFESYTVGPYLGFADFCNPTYTWEFEPNLATGRLRFAAGTGFQKTGSQALTLDQNAFIFPGGSNFLTLNIDLSNYTASAGIELGFSVLESAQENNPDNRVWVRGSLADPWIEIIDLDVVTISGTYVDVSNIDIVGPLSNAGQTVSSETQFRFGQSGTAPANSISFSDGFTFDDVTLTEVTCPIPSGLNVTALLDSTATLGWNSNTAAAGHEVWFGPAGFFQGSNATGGVKTVISSNSLVVDTLTDNSCYDFLIRYVCAPGDTSMWAGPFRFCTPCVPYMAPFNEDFESNTLGFFQGEDNCWTLSNTNPALTSNTNGYSWELRNSVQTSSGGTGASGDHTLYPAIGGQFFNADVSYGTTGDTSALISPIINISNLATPELQYHYHRFGNNMAELHVDVFDGTNWIRINSHTSLVGAQTANNAIWSDTTISLAAYAGTTNLQVRFVTISNGCCAGDNGLDDIRISDPLSCINPQNLAVSGISATDATLLWDSGFAGQSGNYEVSYGINLNDPLLGTSVITAAADSLVLNTLTSSSKYCFYVREICAVGDTSFWTGPFCFNTLCVPVSAPIFEDFENHTLGYFQGSDNCWTIINTNQNMTANTNGYSWELRNSVQTSSGSTGSNGDRTLFPAIGGQFFNADVSYGGAGDTSVLESPIIDISGLTNPEVGYSLHRFGTNMGEFHLDVFDGTNWVRGVHSFTGLTGAQASGTAAWTDTSASLAAYAGITNLQVRFRTVSNGCCPGDNGLDDIFVRNVSSCPAPVSLDTANVTCNSADLLWTSMASTLTSDVEWGLGGFTPGSGTAIVTTTSPTSITGLSPLTAYEFYVRDYCATDTSSWTGPFSFTTPACPPGCVDPNGLDTANVSCVGADLLWSSTATTLSSAIEWGAAGFIPGGGGTIVPSASSPESISGLTPGTSYEFYVVDFCLTDTSNVVGPFTFTTASGPISAAFTEVINAPTLNDQTVDFDASTSVGATSYAWDFGDGNTGATVNPSHPYTADGTYDVELVVTGDCGTDTITRQVILAGISLTENRLGRSLELYPNPAKDVINLNFTTEGSHEAVISIMDLSGKVIFTTSANAIGTYNGHVDIRDFAKGTYILQIESGDLSVKRRIIKQ